MSFRYNIKSIRKMMEFTQNDWGQRDIINITTTLTKRGSDTILNKFLKWRSSLKMTKVNMI